MMLVGIMAAAGPASYPDAVGGPEPESCDIFHPARAPEGLRVMAEDGRLTRVSLSNPTEVKTDRGFGPGDTAAAITAAYGEDVAARPHETESYPADNLTWLTTGAGYDTSTHPPDPRSTLSQLKQQGPEHKK